MLERVDQEMLLAYVEGELPPAERARVEAELSQREGLAELAAAMTADREAVRSLPVADPPRDLVTPATAAAERSLLLDGPATVGKIDGNGWSGHTATGGAGGEWSRGWGGVVGRIVAYGSLAAAVLALAAVGVQQLVWRPDLSTRADDLRVAQAQTPVDAEAADVGAGQAGRDELVDPRVADGAGGAGEAAVAPTAPTPLMPGEGRAEQGRPFADRAGVGGGMVDGEGGMGERDESYRSTRLHEADRAARMGPDGGGGGGAGAGGAPSKRDEMPGWARLLASLQDGQLAEPAASVGRADSTLSAAAVELEVVASDPEAARGEVMRWAAANRAQVIDRVWEAADSSLASDPRRVATMRHEPAPEVRAKMGDIEGEAAAAEADARVTGDPSMQQLVVVIERSRVDDLVAHLNAADPGQQQAQLQRLTRDEQRSVEQYAEALASRQQSEPVAERLARRRMEEAAASLGVADAPGTASRAVMEREVYQAGAGAGAVAGAGAGLAEQEAVQRAVDEDTRADDASHFDSEGGEGGEGGEALGGESVMDVPVAAAQDSIYPDLAVKSDARLEREGDAPAAPDADVDPADLPAPADDAPPAEAPAVRVDYGLILRNQLPLASDASPTPDASPELEAVQVTIRKAAEVGDAGPRVEVEVTPTKGASGESDAATP